MSMTPIAFASDAQFVEQLKTASFSAVYACRNSPDGIDVHILDCGIDDGTWTRYERDIREFAEGCRSLLRLERHVIDMRILKDCPGWTNGSRATWARVLLPDILSEEKMCVYSDCDMLFIENPASILAVLRDAGALLAGHRNPYGSIGPDGRWFTGMNLPYDPDTYVCAGLIGIDLDAFREQHFIREAFSFLEHYPDVISADQTVLNWFCHGRTAVLDEGWGLFPHECFTYDGEIKALHYSGGYAWSRTKNAYDWVGRHCARRETDLLNAFRERIMRTKPFVLPRSAIAHRMVGWSALQVARLLNRMGIVFPGHPCFSEMVALFDGKGTALEKAERTLFAQ